MGNLVSEPVKKILTQYTYNFKKEQLSFKLLPGDFKIESLIINDQEVNAKLRELEIPFQLKFGVLKKFQMKTALLKGKIERIEVEDFIVIMGPARIADPKVEGSEEEKLFSLVLKNLMKEEKKERSLDFISPKVRFQELEEEYKSKKKTTKEKEDKKGGLNIMGTEIFTLIKHFLEINIAIKNITFIYEDNLENIFSNERIDTFITTITFREFRMQTDEVQKNTDKNGIFKNFFNIQSFLEKSGTWSSSNAAHWNITVENVSVSFSVGNPLFVNNIENNEDLTPKQIGLILKRFYENLKLDKLENSFDLIALNKITLDLVLFYKSSSKIPIHAAFLLLDLHQVLFNTETNKISVVLDVVAFFANIGRVKQIKLVKPKFRVLTDSSINKLAGRMKLNSEHKTLLKQFNKYIIKEYFMINIYLIRFSGYLAEGIEADLARLLILKSYCEESRIYNLIFGGKYPRFIDDELKKRQEAVAAKKREEEIAKRKSAGQRLNESKKMMEGDKNFLSEKNVLILNKIHLHFRINLNLKMNILAYESHVPEYSLVINRLTVDLVNPAAHFRAKVHFNINSLLLYFDRDMFPVKNKKKLGIFGAIFGGNKSKNNKTNRTQKSLMEGEAPNLLELQNFGVSVEFSRKQNKRGDFIYFIYLDSHFGPLIHNYHPVIFKNLMRTFIEMGRAFTKNFKFRLAKEVDQQIKDIHKGKNYKKVKKFGLAFKNKAFTKKVEKINEKIGKEAYRKKAQKRFKHIYDSQRNLAFKSEHKKFKKSNVLFDFNHSAKRQKGEHTDALKKLNDSGLLQSDYERGSVNLKKESQQQVLENLTKFFQTIVLELNLKTKPVHINIFDINNEEAMSIKYDDEEIKADVDLAFKEITTVKAFGLEIQSRKSLFALRTLLERIMNNMNEIKNFMEGADHQSRMDSNYLENN